MDLQPLLQVLRTVDRMTDLYARLDSGGTARVGVLDAAKPVTAALLWRHARRPVLLLVPRENDAQALAEQMRAWVGDAAMHYPAHHEIAYTRGAPDHEIGWQRITALARIALASSGGTPPLIVASVAAAAQHTLRPADLGRGAGRIALGDRVSFEGLAVKLVEAGYDIVPLVEAPGQAARRGGLIDVFPPGLDTPVRIEFFGPEVESIRTFSIETQRTIAQLDEVRIGPAAEWFPTRVDMGRLASLLEGSRDKQVLDELSQLRAGTLPEPAMYGPLATTATILDHLAGDAVLVLDETESLDAALTDLDELVSERRADLAERGEFTSTAPFPHQPLDAWRADVDAHGRRAELGRWVTGAEAFSYRLPFRTADAYAGRLVDAAKDTYRQRQRGDRVVIVTQQAQRYREVLAENAVDAPVVEHLTAPVPRSSVHLVQGGMPEGWIVQADSGPVGLVTDRELFGFVKQRRTLRTRASHRSRFLAEVSPGDFVVHADHGIARFGGIVRREVEGEQRDYLELRYAGDDKLYVPVDQVDRVSRYSGPAGHAPRLTRLGTQEWTRARARVKGAVQVVAADLVRLYAARQMLPGHAYSGDTPWQRELEESFPYEETEDQATAIAAVKADMESPRPMDRVICGDVGFGKTEIAVRAAFKAVQEGYQVAVLVPTTVLAQQHLRTFRERLSGFPVSIDVISRFRSDGEVRGMIHAAREGELDILIGTHRLLDPSMEFKNLGLVIIDEEQRFGVTHKERLKRMRLEVDVLTLSATPIPRTLHMALTGIRDMSMIETAPAGRQPVQTFVMESDDAIVREAILHEIDRGGQVFMVHNRVRSIDELAKHVGELVPEARIAVGHGQMAESVLKGVMEKFSDGEFDVLICTTIIESGIDIPNANTLIVDRSDMLGLAQMYQLRGRVGRGANQAYAYLLHPKNRILTEEAQARLATIFEANELGSGFQVALRDLEIRGAGNLLGAEQSGNIASVGFDLYTEMLAEAVEELRASHEHRAPEPQPHEQRDALRAVVIDLPLASYVPESYVPDIEGRLALYQRVAGLRSVEEVEALATETEDRFGPLPEALVNLLAIVRLRIVGATAGIGAIRIEGGEVLVTSAGRPFGERTLPRMPSGIRMGRNQIRLDRAALGPQWVAAIEGLLTLLAGARSPVAV